MVNVVAPLVAGLLIGYVLDQQGRRMMVVCPPGESPPAGFTPISSPLIPVQGVPLPARVQDAWVLQPIDELLAQIAPFAATTTYYLDTLLDSRLSAKVLLVVTDSTGVATTVQVVGHTQDNPSDVNGLVNIGSTQTLSANSKLGLGIDLTTDWYPYLGVTVLSGAAPATTGRVVVRAYGQRWMNLASQAAFRV